MSEAFSRGDLYRTLGLDETASSRAIGRALLNFRFATTAEREAAYRVLGDPFLRASYDLERGYGAEEMRREIGRRWADWGGVWAAILGFLAFTMLFGDNTTRLVGSNFAPDFREERYFDPYAEACDSRDRCVTGMMVSRFTSSDDAWTDALNNLLLMGLVPSLTVGAVAALGPFALNPAAGRLIAWTRLRGAKDGGVRLALWLFALLLPFSAVALTFAYGLGRLTDYS